MMGHKNMFLLRNMANYSRIIPVIHTYLVCHVCIFKFFQNLVKVIEATGVKGFADVVVSENVTSGLCHL